MMLVSVDRLTHDAERRVYSTEVGLNGERVHTSIASGDGADPEGSAARLNEVLDWASRSWAPLDGCADELLEVYNEDWVDEDHPPLTRAQFRRKLRLAEVWVGGDGAIDLTYRDGGMFWGHDIVLHVDRDLTPGEATLEG
jgi:hypothetical protein